MTQHFIDSTGVGSAGPPGVAASGGQLGSWGGVKGEVTEMQGHDGPPFLEATKGPVENGREGVNGGQRKGGRVQASGARCAEAEGNKNKNQILAFNSPN